MGKQTETTQGSVSTETQTQVAPQGEVDQEAVRTQVKFQLGQLARDIRDLVDARKTALERLVEDSEPQEIENSAEDLVITAVAIAIGAATAGIGGVIAASMASAATGAAKEFIKSATKDVIDSQLNDLLSGAVQAYTGSWGNDGTVDPRKAFFRGPADAMHLSKGLIDREILSSSHEDLIMQDSDPVHLVEELQQQVRANLETAARLQREESLVEWLNLLARVDLGETPAGGTDVDAAGGIGVPYVERLGQALFGEAPRGVVRMRIRADDTDENVDILETKIAGINEELVEELAGLGQPIGDLGMTLFVYGEVYSHLPDENGYIEVGKNPSGEHFTEGSPLGKSWLAYYGRRERTPQDERGDLVGFVGGADSGTQRLMDEYIGKQKFGDLGWENNRLHKKDGVPQHG